MTNELTPARCGCGGVAEVRDYKTLSDETAFYVSCRVCDTTTRSFLTKDKAITVWNKAMGTEKVDELMEHIWREKLDTRERIANLVERMLR